MRAAFLAVALSLAPSAGFSGEAAFRFVPNDPLQREAEKTYAFIADLDRQGLGLPDIFQKLCSRALESKLEPSDTLKVTFAAMYLWTERGGHPEFQGRRDWALHFIYGGWLSALYGTASAEETAFEKERRDASTPGNAFDLGDLSVTYFGARWAGRAALDFRARLAPWADGRQKLDGLPANTLKMLPPQTLPDQAQLKAVEAWVASALGGN